MPGTKRAFASSRHDPPPHTSGGNTNPTDTLRSGATTMRDEYDFSQGQHGKFFRKDAALDLRV